MCIEKYAKRYEAQLYALFRVFVGLLFAQHGVQKLFGLLGGTAQTMFSQMWFVGVLELVAGIAIALGLFTRLFALLAGLEMLAAVFMAHWKPPFWPIQTKGELALVYFAAFAVLTLYGNGKYALEKKERF